MRTSGARRFFGGSAAGPPSPATEAVSSELCPASSLIRSPLTLAIIGAHQSSAHEEASGSRSGPILHERKFVGFDLVRKTLIWKSKLHWPTQNGECGEEENEGSCRMGGTAVSNP